MAFDKRILIDLPCGVSYSLDHLMLDLNGTLTFDGLFVDGVCERLIAVSQIMNVHIVTADTNQTVDELARKVADVCSLDVHRLAPGRGDLQKLSYLDRLGREATASIGNGCNDVLMLKESALGICVLGPEGASTEALMASDITFPDIRDALDIFLKPNRLIATLRK